MIRVALSVALIFSAALTIAVLAGRAQEPPPLPTVTVTKSDRAEERRLVRERETWRRSAQSLARTVRRLRHVIRYNPTVSEAIAVASVVYGVSYGTLFRKASCESRLYPRARNRSSSAAGLFQFLPSTFASTPFGGFSIWSPYANALAAAWMHRVGRGGEWVCR